MGILIKVQPAVNSLVALKQFRSMDFCDIDEAKKRYRTTFVSEDMPASVWDPETRKYILREPPILSDFYISFEQIAAKTGQDISTYVPEIVSELEKVGAIVELTEEPGFPSIKKE